MSDEQTVVNVNLTVAAQPAKSLGMAILLWWFLGAFGGHRFYLERPHAKTMLILGVTVVGLAVTAVWCLIDIFRLSEWVRERNSAAVGGMALTDAT